MRREQLPWPAVLLVAAAAPSFAHDADLIDVKARRSGHEVVEALVLTPATLRLLAPVDVDGDGALTQGELDARWESIRAGVWGDAPVTAGARRCALGSASARFVGGKVELGARFLCGEGEITQAFRFLSVLPSGYGVVVRTESGADRFAQGHLQTVTLFGGPARDRTGWLGWVGVAIAASVVWLALARRASLPSGGPKASMTSSSSSETSPASASPESPALPAGWTGCSRPSAR